MPCAVYKAHNDILDILLYIFIIQQGASLFAEVPGFLFSHFPSHLFTSMSFGKIILLWPAPLVWQPSRQLQETWAKKCMCDQACFKPHFFQGCFYKDGCRLWSIYENSCFLWRGVLPFYISPKNMWEEEAVPENFTAEKWPAPAPINKHPLMILWYDITVYQSKITHAEWLLVCVKTGFCFVANGFFTRSHYDKQGRR